MLINQICHQPTNQAGERPYRCNMCSRTFSDSSTLTKHCRIHSGEKPYQCDYCPLNFSQSGNLSRHLKLHLMASGLQQAPNNSTSSSNSSSCCSAGSSSNQSLSSSSNNFNNCTHVPAKVSILSRSNALDNNTGNKLISAQNEPINAS